ncbi:general substrate transporter [Dacryopinax primogenitus]|uniref:General substrate transporter n=1 Tax=Dacryopinax primogenitus (strain DJM 731) TaxID=1858805 RepID=M5GCT6_DACPD|nr:general substrate transporter [Dacryopinax primogenitus]EJU01963.1 general substrate transporter [Dacryopinax primogenitus]
MGYLKSILFCVFVAFGGFLFGYDIGVISGCLVMPDFINRFGEPTGPNGEMVLSATRQSLITSLLSVGTTIGALAQAFTADSLGRRASIAFWAGIFTIGVAIQISTTYSLGQIVFGRFFAGLGVGAMSAIVPLYNGEAAPKKIRGALLALYQFQIMSGLFISYCIDLGTSNIANSASWRIPVGIQMLWGLILILALFILPESPRHLLGLHREDEARRSIAILNNVPIDDILVHETIDELREAIREENEGGKATWIECFSHRNKLYWRTINGMMLQFVQQLNGQNFYYYYGDTFFKSANLNMSAYVIQVILGGVSVVATIPGMYVVEKWGRRTSLLVGALWQAACAIIAGLVGHYTLAPVGTPPDQLTARNIAGGDVLIAFAIIHVFAFNMFWGPVPWVYLGESFPLRVRPKAIALGSATNWVWNFLLGYFSPTIADEIGPLITMVFFGMLIYGTVYVYFFVPETKGLSLEEVDEMYRSGVKPWNSAKFKPHDRHLHAKEHGDLNKPVEFVPETEEGSLGQGSGEKKDSAREETTYVENA